MNRNFTRVRPLKRMASLIMLALLIPALSSCVTYYYPAPEQEQGVYYAADDPEYTGSSVDYVAVSYYPWWSVDYFYLGYGYYGSGVSIGFSYGSPWWPSYAWSVYPPYWLHSPWHYAWWYPPYYHHGWHGHHHHSSYWHVHNQHHRDRYDYRRDRPGYRPYDDDRYVDNGRRGHDGRDEREPSDADYGHFRATGYGRDEIGSWDGTGSTQRRVTVAPGNGTSDRGMVVASRDGGKWSRSRLEPVGAAASARVSEPGAGHGYSATEPVRRSRVVRSDGTTVVSPAQSKPSRSRTSPVSDPVVVNAQPRAQAPTSGASVSRSTRLARPATGSRDNGSHRGLNTSARSPGATLGSRPSSRSASAPSPRPSRSASSRSSAKAKSPARSVRSPSKSEGRRKD